MYRPNRDHKKHWASVAIHPIVFITCAGLLGSATSDNAKVFDQIESGIASPIRGDEARNALPAGDVEIGNFNGLSDADQSDSTDLQVSAIGSAVILDDLPDVRSQEPLGIPPPSKVFHGQLGGERGRMAKMAAEVGAFYSRHPGVSEARLDRTSFVNLFTALIRRESNFNPRAISPKGAKGLGQLMPATARELGVCDVFSPRQNLEGAAIYLTSMLQQFDSPALALAAYNAGPAAVARYQDVPPYSETRRYVADIMHAATRDQHGFSDNSNVNGSLDSYAEPGQPSTTVAYLNAPSIEFPTKVECREGSGSIQSASDLREAKYHEQF